MKMQVALLGAMLMLASSGTYSSAQQAEGPGNIQSPRVKVDAAFAEYLVLKEKAMHPEIQKLGMHAVPPRQTQSAIIANNVLGKIGKLSAPSDLKIVASGKPKAEKEDGFWDTFVPLHDRTGKVIGFLVMEVPFSTAKVHEDAIAVGISIRNEVEQQVPRKSILFGAAPRV